MAEIQLLRVSAYVHMRLREYARLRANRRVLLLCVVFVRSVLTLPFQVSSPRFVGLFVLFRKGFG